MRAASVPAPVTFVGQPLLTFQGSGGGVWTFISGLFLLPPREPATSRGVVLPTRQACVNQCFLVGSGSNLPAEVVIGGWCGCLGPSLLATRRKPAAGESLDLSREAGLRSGERSGGGRRKERAL